MTDFFDPKSFINGDTSGSSTAGGGIFDLDNADDMFGDHNITANDTALSEAGYISGWDKRINSNEGVPGAISRYRKNHQMGVIVISVLHVVIFLCYSVLFVIMVENSRLGGYFEEFDFSTAFGVLNLIILIIYRDWISTFLNELIKRPELFKQLMTELQEYVLTLGSIPMFSGPYSVAYEQKVLENNAKDTNSPRPVFDIKAHATIGDQEAEKLWDYASAMNYFILHLFSPHKDAVKLEAFHRIKEELYRYWAENGISPTEHTGEIVRALISCSGQALNHMNMIGAMKDVACADAHSKLDGVSVNISKVYNSFTVSTPPFVETFPNVVMWIYFLIVIPIQIYSAAARFIIVVYPITMLCLTGGYFFSKIVGDPFHPYLAIKIIDYDKIRQVGQRSINRYRRMCLLRRITLYGKECFDKKENRAGSADVILSDNDDDGDKKVR